MSVTATPPRSSRPRTSAPPSPYADRDAGPSSSPLRRSRGFATNLSACAGEEGEPSTDSPTFHTRKSERIAQWRSNVSPSHTPKTHAALARAMNEPSSVHSGSPYTPRTHSALARAIGSDSDSDSEPPRPVRETRRSTQPRTPPASSRKLGSAIDLNMSPLSHASPAPVAKVRFLAEPMRRYNSLPTPPAAWSPSRVPRSIGLYDLNLHATPPRSKYKPRKLDLGGPLPLSPAGPLTPSPELEEER